MYIFSAAGQEGREGMGRGTDGGQIRSEGTKKRGGTRGRREQIGIGKLVWDAGAGSNRH